MGIITFGALRAYVADSRVLALSHDFMNMTGPMSNLVDFLPTWLQEGLPWEMKRRANELNTALMETYGQEVRRVERDMKNDVHVEDCLVKTMITRREKDKLDDIDIATLASAFMLESVGATGSIIQWFTALISTHTHVQRRAHEELDRVVGRSRARKLRDKAILPYRRAIVKEVERCHNLFWLGILHAVSKDLICNDKLIPAGSVLLLNTRTMHHDPARWSGTLPDKRRI